MIIACHQPQYLPWLGFFHKVACADALVLLDGVQYTKREFQNRNKIRTSQGWSWLTVPVVTKGKYTQRLGEVEVDPTALWRRKHWKAIRFWYKRAPYFARYAPALEAAYAEGHARLVEWNELFIRWFLQELGIRTRMVRESELGTGGMKTERLVAICRALGADVYLSGVGGRAYLDEGLMGREGIRLAYQEFEHPRYPQCQPGFEPYMSTLDLLMNCGSESRGILLGGMANPESRLC